MEIRDIVFSDLLGQYLGRTLTGETVIIPQDAARDIQAAGEWEEQPDGLVCVGDVENYGFCLSLGEVWESAKSRIVQERSK